MILAVAAVLGALCDPLPPVRDNVESADSAAYTTVGDDARGRDVRTAALAYRKAIVLDPRNAHARDALAALCAADRSPDELTAAIATFRSGALDAAARAFAALVDREPGAAHFFLGVIAVSRHDRRTAERELALAARDPVYAALARDTLRATRRDGAIAATALVVGEVDTNPQLVPDTPPQGAVVGPPATDEDVLAGGSVTVRPAPWLTLRDLASYRAQRTQTDLDFFSETAEVAGELQHDRLRGTLTYDLDYDALAGASYLIANRLAVAGRREGATLALVAEYAIRQRDYLEDAQAGFTGWVHSGELGTTWHASPALDVDAAVVAWRELTADPTFTDTAIGVRVAARLRASRRVRLSADATAWYASYDTAEPGGALRRDHHVEGELRAEADVTDLVTATAGVAAAWNDSTVEDFVYTRLVARLGVAVALGAP
jgi:hypothetical protein